jgi:type I restriction-modification system DNA methylase subunit
MAKMNMFLHDYTNSSFAIGDTFRKPGFGPEGTLLKFDYAVANPMWLRKLKPRHLARKIGSYRAKKRCRILIF